MNDPTIKLNVERLRNAALEKEVERLHAVETAAIELLASMSRRNGKPSAFTLRTFKLIEALDDTLQQDDEGDE